jgi:hypothetical protein
MPDARVTLLDDGEDLHRKDLTPAERRAGLLRYAAASREPDGEKLATELPVLGSDAKSASKGGRGKIAATAKLAGKLGLTKAAVQKQIKAASDAIGEPINLDHDTPEELKRKAAELEVAGKRQRAEPKAKPPKHRERAPQEVVNDSGEIDREIEEVWRAFSALSQRKQLKIMLRACRRRGWALRMGRARRIPAVDEEPAVALLPEAAPATYDTAVDSQPEQQEGGADVSADDLQHGGDAVSQAADQEPELAVDLPAEVPPATDVVPMELQAQQQDGAAVVDTGDLLVTGIHVCEGADQEPNGANAAAEHLQDAGVKSSEAANQEPSGATRCAYCTMEFYSSDERVMIHGRLYHADLCAKYAKPPIAIAA